MEKPTENHDQDPLLTQAWNEWLQLPEQTRSQILDNFWCGHCLDAVTAVEWSMGRDGRTVFLDGQCARCGQGIRRVLEGLTLKAAPRSARPGRRAAKAAATGIRTICSLHVTLLDVEPAVWRRIQVPADIRLDKLHRVLQVAMGWKNCHLYEFASSDGSVYGMPQDDWDEGLLNVKKAVLRELAARAGERFMYCYDMGDDWRHEVIVEEVREETEFSHPRILGGERVCPPEDCGGPPGFEEIQAQFRLNPADRDRDLVNWLGRYKPDRAIDAEKIGRALGRIKV